MASFSVGALAPYLILFAALYSGFGVQSPYLPAFLDEHGMESAAIGPNGFWVMAALCAAAVPAARRF